MHSHMSLIGVPEFNPLEKLIRTSLSYEDSGFFHGNKIPEFGYGNSLYLGTRDLKGLDSIFQYKKLSGLKSVD